MDSLRALAFQHRKLALLVAMLALVIRALIPDGFMPDFGAKTITIQICADSLGGHLTREIALNRASQTDQRGHGSGQYSKGDGFCAFSVLGHGVVGGASYSLLVVGLAFIMALSFAAVALPAPRRSTFLRPPLRGPPATL